MSDEVQQVTLAVNAVGPGRSETLMGREYRVVPAVLVREQVLHNNLGRTFLPYAEISQNVEAWAGIPVVVRHPNGRSARDPRVLNRTGVGYIFAPRAENGALKAEVWLDMGLVRSKDEVRDMVGNAEAGIIGEVSTGFGTLVRNESGTHNGEPYDMVMTRIQPDHLALLPDERGACSVADGCGLARNTSAECSCGCNGGEMAEHEEDTAEAVIEEVAEVSANASEGDAPAATTANQEGGTMAENENAQNEGDTVRALRAELRSLRAEHEALQARTAFALQQEEIDRVRLVEEIVANRANQWTEAEIDSMDIGQIRKLHRALETSTRAANYGARGGPRSGGFDTSFVKGILGPNSVLTDREA